MLRLSWLLGLFWMCSGCGPGEGNQVAHVAGTTEVDALNGEIATVAARQVVFAHQSVGNNVLDGVRSLAGEQSPLAIRETREAAATEAGLMHFLVGRNEAPLEKIEDFSRTFTAGAFPGADLALLKLCYIDFNATTDGRALGEQYVRMLDEVQSQRPSTRFLAVTAPLTVLQTGPKAWIKGMLGREPGGAVENRQRAAFNAVLRARYAAEGRLFDLASVEAHGAPEPQALSPELASDGRHLNARGGELVARELLQFLAAQP